MRTRQRVSAGPVVGLLALAVVACAPRTVVPPPSRPIPMPVPAPAPVVEVTPTRFSIPALVTDTRYALESRTTLVRDSAGRREEQEVTSEAQATVRYRRTPSGGLSGTGRLSHYTVTSGFSSTPVRVDSLGFDVTLDDVWLRVMPVPALINECDRPETSALALVRDVLLRIPASVAVGDSWQDSTVQVVCRSNVALVMRTTHRYTVADSGRRNGATQLVIRRTSQSRLEGKTATAWRSIDIRGTGEGTLDARVSMNSGAVEQVESTSTLTLTVSDRTSSTSLRTQQVTQRVTLRARVVD
ncbi:MAG: hypothetical protein IT353_08205 [Gemmatimonadaceae bacterium]|nr:hypothetical protein [Gemmatimonadaceae bacterium]